MAIVSRGGQVIDPGAATRQETSNNIANFAGLAQNQRQMNIQENEIQLNAINEQAQGLLTQYGPYAFLLNKPLIEKWAGLVGIPEEGIYEMQDPSTATADQLAMYARNLFALKMTNPEKWEEIEPGLSDNMRQQISLIADSEAATTGTPKEETPTASPAPGGKTTETQRVVEGEEKPNQPVTFDLGGKTIDVVRGEITNSNLSDEAKNLLLTDIEENFLTGKGAAAGQQELPLSYTPGFQLLIQEANDMTAATQGTTTRGESAIETTQETIPYEATFKKLTGRTPEIADPTGQWQFADRQVTAEFGITNENLQRYVKNPTSWEEYIEPRAELNGMSAAEIDWMRQGIIAKSSGATPLEMGPDGTLPLYEAQKARFSSREEVPNVAERSPEGQSVSLDREKQPPRRDAISGGGRAPTFESYRESIGPTGMPIGGLIAEAGALYRSQDEPKPVAEARARRFVSTISNFGNNLKMSFDLFKGDRGGRSQRQPGQSVNDTLSASARQARRARVEQAGERFRNENLQTVWEIRKDIGGNLTTDPDRLSAQLAAIDRAVISRPDLFPMTSSIGNAALASAFETQEAGASARRKTQEADLWDAILYGENGEVRSQVAGEMARSYGIQNEYTLAMTRKLATEIALMELSTAVNGSMTPEERQERFKEGSDLLMDMLRVQQEGGPNAVALLNAQSEAFNLQYAPVMGTILTVTEDGRWAVKRFLNPRGAQPELEALSLEEYLSSVNATTQETSDAADAFVNSLE